MAVQNAKQISRNYAPRCHREREREWESEDESKGGQGQRSRVQRTNVQHEIISFGSFSGVMRHQLNQKVKQTNCKIKTSSKNWLHFYLFFFLTFLHYLACCSTVETTTKNNNRSESESKSNSLRNWNIEHNTHTHTHLQGLTPFWGRRKQFPFVKPTFRN